MRETLSDLMDKNRLPVRKFGFLFGCVMLSTYVLSIVFPYYFQGYATMPMTREAAVNPTGVPSFALINLFAYFFGMPFYGACWLVSSSILVAWGKFSENRWLDRAMRTVLLILHLFLLVNLQNYRRISMVLDT